MVYKTKDDNKEYYYEVTFDRDKLKEIFNELEKYSYYKICKVKSYGDLVKFPATKNNIMKRIIKRLPLDKRALKDDNAKLLVDSITLNMDNNQVTYDILHKKSTDLYQYIDFILNDNLDNLTIYNGLIITFQTVIDGILNYSNSDELVNNNPENDKRINNKDYDYQGLKELYQKTLGCFKFKLIAVKEHIDNQDLLDGVVFKSRKLIKK